MGTRNLTMVVKGGQYKVAQYCQWDGYPSGQGATVLKFLREQVKWDEFHSSLDKCKFISDEEIERRWKEMGADDIGATMEVSNKFKRSWPQLQRDMGAYVLMAIQMAPDGLELQDNHLFAADSLFCEWAYLIDLDAGNLEVYEGFNEQPLDPSERFASMLVEKNKVLGKTYYPIKIVQTWPLTELPALEEFLKALEPEEEYSDTEHVQAQLPGVKIINN